MQAPPTLVVYPEDTRDCDKLQSEGGISRLPVRLEDGIDKEKLAVLPEAAEERVVDQIVDSPARHHLVSETEGMLQRRTRLRPRKAGHVCIGADGSDTPAVLEVAVGGGSELHGEVVIAIAEGEWMGRVHGDAEDGPPIGLAHRFPRLISENGQP